MDTADLHPLVDDFSSNIDDLEETLAPLLQTALSHSTSKLPLLDKAKAYVLATYAIESILFSYLRLNGMDAKVHPVFQELARVKEYFGKIKAAEMTGTKRSTAVDKEAASRFIKHSLAGNEKYDRERAERMAAEKAGAKRKLEDVATGTHTRFDGAAKRMKASEEQHIPSDRDEPRSGATPSATADFEWRLSSNEKKSPMVKKATQQQRRLERRLAKAQAGEEAAIMDGVSAEKGSAVQSSGAAMPSPALRTSGDVDIDIDSSTHSKKGKKRKKRRDRTQQLEDARADEMK